MLPKDDIEIQARAFVTFAAKRDNRGVAIRPLFLRWSASKKFTAADSLAIWQVVQASYPRAQERHLLMHAEADPAGARK